VQQHRWLWNTRLSQQLGCRPRGRHERTAYSTIARFTLLLSRELAWRADASLALRLNRPIHPFVNSNRKPEPSYYPALAAFDIKVDRKSKFPVLPLAVAAVCQTVANARLRTELTKGCMSAKARG
jgi:hypothetical protein